MNIKVLYHSSGGNTQKIANNIGRALNVTATSIEDESSAFSEKVDLLFIGDGIYFGNASKKMRNFISGIDPNMIKNVAVFATHGGKEKIGTIIKELLEKKGLKVVGTPYVCLGQWLVFSKGHPNEEEVNGACSYAQQIVEMLKN